MSAKKARTKPVDTDWEAILDNNMHACVMPKGSRFTLWVQSPNEQWMLLSGGWITLSGATQYALKAGYKISTNRREVLDQIEAQLNQRAGDHPSMLAN